jgi:hypothetical protein
MALMVASHNTVTHYLKLAMGLAPQPSDKNLIMNKIEIVINRIDIFIKYIVIFFIIALVGICVSISLGGAWLL